MNATTDGDADTVDDEPTAGPDPTDTDHAAGHDQAADNADNEPPG